MIPSNNSTFLKLAIKLLDLLGNKPVVLSPLSICAAMGVVQAGAEGETLFEINNALFGGNDSASVNTYFFYVLPALKLPRVTTAVFVGKQCPIQPEYEKTVNSAYAADVKTVDFTINADVERETINKWIEDASEGRIQEVIGPGMLNSNTILVIVNCIYFSANFVNGFTGEKTELNVFINEDGSTKMVNTMQGEMKFDETYGFPRFLSTQHFQYADFAFNCMSDPENYRFFLVVPKRNFSLSAIRHHLQNDSEAISALSEKACAVEVLHVTMPKFQTEFTSDLKATLALLGIKAAFTNGQFPGITHDPAKIDFILHKVKFEIDEFGVTAAAATAISMVGFSAITPSRKPKEAWIEADRPFLYGVMYKDVPLFVGQYY